MVKKNSIAYVIFSYVVGLTSSRGSHSHQEKPFYSSCQYSYKALKSSWKQRPRQIPCFEHSFQSSSNGHSHTLLQNQTGFRSRLRQLNELLRYFVSSVLCRSFHKSYRCVCVAYSTSRIADLFKSADKQVKAF